MKPNRPSTSRSCSWSATRAPREMSATAQLVDPAPDVATFPESIRGAGLPPASRSAVKSKAPSASASTDVSASVVSCVSASPAASARSSATSCRPNSNRSWPSVSRSPSKPWRARSAAFIKVSPPRAGMAVSSKSSRSTCPSSSTRPESIKISRSSGTRSRTSKSTRPRSSNISRATRTARARPAVSRSDRDANPRASSASTAIVPLMRSAAARWASSRLTPVRASNAGASRSALLTLAAIRPSRNRAVPPTRPLMMRSVGLIGSPVKPTASSCAPLTRPVPISVARLMSGSKNPEAARSDTVTRCEKGSSASRSAVRTSSKSKAPEVARPAAVSWASVTRFRANNLVASIVSLTRPPSVRSTIETNSLPTRSAIFTSRLKMPASTRCCSVMSDPSTGVSMRAALDTPSPTSSARSMPASRSVATLSSAEISPAVRS